MEVDLSSGNWKRNSLERTSMERRRNATGHPQRQRRGNSIEFHSNRPVYFHLFSSGVCRRIGRVAATPPRPTAVRPTVAISSQIHQNTKI